MRTLGAFLRWFVGGYAFGFLGWLGLIAPFAWKDWKSHQNATQAFNYWVEGSVYGFLWAVPWAVAAGLCGLASRVAGPKTTAAATAIGLAAGVAFDFQECGSFDGWLALTIPIHGIAGILMAVGLTFAVSTVARAG